MSRIIDHYPFTYEEFIKPYDKPSQAVLNNLYTLVEEIGPYRLRFGNVWIVTSGYRNEQDNKRVGGVKNSTHTKGQAADFDIKSFKPEHLRELNAKWSGGFGLYKTFIHLDNRGYRARWRDRYWQGRAL